MTRSFARRGLAALALAVPLLLAAGCTPTPPAAADSAVAATAAAVPQLTPLPAMLAPAPGQFVLDAQTPVHASGDAAARVAGQFIAYLQAAGRPAPTLVAGEGKGGIRFVLDEAAQAGPAEGYVLDVAADGVTVKAGHEAGLFYGAVTLWQLATEGEGARIALPALHIEDAPRFGWRGFMLDSARHFWSVDEVKRVLDAMALHKLNTFHWHLTDDQGWRVEIKQYPKLTAIGGCRIPAGDGGKDPKTGAPRPYCGYYTQDQIREVVKYAAERHITVVPEVDVPGHATAAIAAYPELGTIDTPLVPSSEWGVFSNLFNTEEGTVRFLENVIAEMVPLFPGAYFHIGGDEAVKDQWEASARVQQRMREAGARTEMEMQGLLVERLEKFLAGHGKRLIGWDEILESKLPAEATVMSWRGTEGGLQAARQGHDVVMSPSSKTYLDYLQTASPNEPPGRPALITLQDIYAFEPVPADLEQDRRHHVLGLQANLWTEHTRSFARLQHHMFPRLAAVAETGWTPAEKKDFAGFTARLPALIARYDALGLGYAKTPFEAMIAVEDDRKAGTAKITLSNPLDYPMHYTTDGSEPTLASPAFGTPLDVKLPVTVRAAAFADGRALAPAATWQATPASLLTRTDEALSICPDAGRLLLRLEDDGPADGARAIFNATIFYPCWQWNQADLDGIAAVRVRAGRIPYYFQLAHDEPNRKFEPAKTPHGELQVLGGGCKGRLLAEVPLPAAPGADGFLELDAPLPAGTGGRQDLCLRFTGDTRPQMWVLDRATLQPR